MEIIYGLLLVVTTIYSYALVDPNITFLQSKWWVGFREVMVQFGYYQRNTSWFIYVILIFLLTFFHLYFVKNWKRYKPLKIAFIVGGILFISYPFLSHDFFNYLFDAKILTFYHQNPYIFKALDFPQDPWLRFTQWTHRTYPYGPTFLVFSAIPSWLSGGKFLLDYLLFKFMYVFFYILGVYVLQKKKREEAILFATHPLILIEGLVVAHNDFIAVVLALIGMFLMINKQKCWGRIVIVLSAGIKYITAPVLFFSIRNKSISYLLLGVVVILILYLSFTREVQSWYFLNLFVLLIFGSRLIKDLLIFLTGLLLSYFPYIALGDWGDIRRVETKHLIILSFAILNLVYILPKLIYFLEKKKFFRR